MSQTAAAAALHTIESLVAFLETAPSENRPSDAALHQLAGRLTELSDGGGTASTVDEAVTTVTATVPQTTSRKNMSKVRSLLNEKNDSDAHTTHATLTRTPPWLKIYPSNELEVECVE